MVKYSKKELVKLLEERSSIKVKDSDGKAYYIALRKNDEFVYVNYREGDDGCIVYEGFIDWKLLVDNWGIHDYINTYKNFTDSLKQVDEERYVPKLEKVIKILCHEGEINVDRLLDDFSRMRYQLESNLI
jgi:hypothetical protein